MPGSYQTSASSPDVRALPRALLPARLLWDKGLAELIEAARLLRAEGRPVHLLLAGNPDPGNPAAVPEETVRGWVGEGLVEWLGHVEDMPALYRSVDMVVLPSYREGLPKGLIEAAACGLPLVTPRVRIEVASLWELLCEHWGHHPAAEGGVGGAGSTGRSP